MGYLYVPATYATIQAAFVAAADGDTIWVSPTYAGPKGAVSERLSSLYLYVPAQVTGVEVILRYGLDRTVTLIGDGNVKIHGGDGNDRLIGSTGNESLYGNGGNDRLEGGAGNDLLDGWTGDDTLAGGRGNDTLYGSFNNDTADYLDATGTQGVIVDLSTGKATDNWGYTDTLESIENVNGSSQDDRLTALDLHPDLGTCTLSGNGGNDQLYGKSGNDKLDGGDGDDLLTGGSGKDMLIGGAGSDTANYLEATGTQGVTVDLAAGKATDNWGYVDTLSGIENVIGSNLADMLTGDGQANVLTGNAGNDTLDGALGADKMIGGLGNDTYYVDNAGDQAIEAGGEGIDTVYAKVNYTLGVNIENLWANAGSISLALTGNTLGNALTGGAGKDRLYGLDGNDMLDGKSGADMMTGGTGDDTYRVDIGSDKTIELAGEGFDTVLSSVNHTLAANLERLQLFGAHLTGQGNALANILIGDSSMDGKLYGHDGADTLTGGSGADTLDGGSGADTMLGGAGNDTYTVDDAGDVVREDSTPGVDDGGTDQVNASVSYTLGAFVENLTLTGSAAIDGIGNSLANKINGTSGVNHLYGGAGGDTLAGKGGADFLDGGEDGDVYIVDSSDIIHDTGTAGIDKVQSNGSYSLAAGSGIEQLTTKAGVVGGNLMGDEAANVIIGNTGTNILSGKAGNDTLSGGAGIDTLIGGLGRDRMTGGADADIFRFALGDSLATTVGYDTVVDFDTGIDRIDLSIFGGSAAASTYAEISVTSNNFATLKSAAEAQMIGGVKVVFVAGSANGWLFWNTDATRGTAEEAIALTGRTSLGAFAVTDLA